MRREVLPSAPPDFDKEEGNDSMISALLLIAVGFMLLLNNLGILPWQIWRSLWRFWPVLLILLGLRKITEGNRVGRILVNILGSATLILIIILAAAAYNAALKNYLNNRFPYLPLDNLKDISTTDYGY